VHRRQLERHRHHAVVPRLRLASRTGRQRVIAHFLDEVGQYRIARGFDLPPQTDDDVVPPFHQIDDPRRQARGVQAQPDHVDRRCQQHWIDAGDQAADRPVRRRHRPVPIDRQSRIRVMHAQDQVDTLACRLKRRIVQRAFLIGRREPRRPQHHVPFAQRNRHPVGQMQQHLMARHGPAGLQETEVFRGDFRVAGEIQLAQAAALSPFPDQVANGTSRMAHTTNLSRFVP